MDSDEDDQSVTSYYSDTGEYRQRMEHRLQPDEARINTYYAWDDIALLLRSWGHDQVKILHPSYLRHVQEYINWFCYAEQLRIIHCDLHLLKLLGTDGQPDTWSHLFLKHRLVQRLIELRVQDHRFIPSLMEMVHELMLRGERNYMHEAAIFVQKYKVAYEAIKNYMHMMKYGREKNKDFPVSLE